jgi:hypothetical protein
MLSLVGRRVRGYGAVSRWVEGEIQALFYRYNHAGDSNMCDFFIGPRTPKEDEPPPRTFVTRRAIPARCGLWNRRPSMTSSTPRAPPANTGRW